jgi:hypothetical protein
MEPDDPLCSRNARPQKVGRKGVRSFLCSRSARPPKGLARQPQSKAPHALAWLSIELGVRVRTDARSWRLIRPPIDSDKTRACCNSAIWRLNQLCSRLVRMGPRCITGSFLHGSSQQLFFL